MKEEKTPNYNELGIENLANGIILQAVKNFQHPEQFGHDETMVDWFAIQFPKILKIYTELAILD